MHNLARLTSRIWEEKEIGTHSM